MLLTATAFAQPGVPLEAADERRGGEAVRADDEVIPAAELCRLEERVRDLEWLLGRKTIEVEILKEALELARAKPDLAVQLCAAGRFPMKMVTDTLGVARSSIAERVKGTGPKRGPQTRDVDLPIRRFVDTRPIPAFAGAGSTVWPRSTPSASTG
jgi:hypothetical protein